MRKKVGEILVEADLITNEQLEQALLLQKGKNKRLGKVLVELGFVTDVEIAEALSGQLAIPFVDCTAFEVPPQVLELVPRELAEKALVLPLSLKEKTLMIAMADPLDWYTMDALRFRTGLKIEASVAPERRIVDLVEKVYGNREKEWDLLKAVPVYPLAEFVKEEEDTDNQVNLQSLYKLSEAPPIIKLVSMVLVDAVTAQASDVHFEPTENLVQVRYRVDGDMRNVLQYPKHLHDSVISRIKIISNLDITNRRLPQDGRSTLRLENKTVELRISTLPSIHGEKIVARVLDQNASLLPLASLGFQGPVFQDLIEIVKQPQGLCLVTGPTGSGKTTALYAVLRHLCTEKNVIVTIEDPVEYKLPGITQVPTNEAIGLSFAKALRSILRQDPDIIMVGEMRDGETAEIAIRSAMTGHFVLSTLHTNDTVSTISRVTDLGIEPFLITSALSGILAQRLVKKICPSCKAEIEPPADLERIGLPPLKTAFKGTGCKLCNYTGYKGRMGVYEWLKIDRKIKRLIARRATDEELWVTARENGIITLFEDAWFKVTEGVTTVDEVIAKVPYNRFINEPHQVPNLMS